MMSSKAGNILSEEKMKKNWRELQWGRRSLIGSLGLDLNEGIIIKSKDLEGCVLSCRNFDGADFSHSNLKNVDFAYSSLIEANLSFTDLENADLRRANLINALMFGANIKGCKVNNETILPFSLKDAQKRGVVWYN